jgi:hypothetical protein
MVLSDLLNKDKQCYTKHIAGGHTIPWTKPTRTNNIIQNTSKDVRQYHGQNRVLYNIFCPCWFWQWYCLTFFDVFCITLFVLVGFGHGIVWSSVIQNTSKNVRQYHGQNQQGQTMLYKTHRRTSDNTIAKTNKDKQCYTKHCALYNIVCPCWFWSCYCLTFFNLFCVTLFVLVGFGHGIVWRSLMCFV